MHQLLKFFDPASRSVQNEQEKYFIRYAMKSKMQVMVTFFKLTLARLLNPSMEKDLLFFAFDIKIIHIKCFENKDH